jgi:hypothetical protein
MGLAASYGVPLILVAITLVGYALCNRSDQFALAAGLVINAAVTAGYLLAPRIGPLVFDAAVWIRLAQLNAAVAAVYGTLWIALSRRTQRRQPDQSTIGITAPLGTQVALAPTLLMLMFAWAWCDLVIYPQGHSTLTRVMNAQLVDAWGLLSVSVVAVTGMWLVATAGRRVSVGLFGAVSIAIIVLSAAIAGRWDIGNWLAYNTLGIGHALLVGALLALAWRDRRVVARGAKTWFLGSGSTVWVDFARAVVLVLALREFTFDRWWAVGGFVVLALTGGCCAWIFQRRRYLYDAAVFVNVAGSVAWLQAQILPGPRDFVFANIVLLAAPAPIWLLIELLSVRHRSATSRVAAPPVHRVVTRLSIAALGVAAGIGLFRDAEQLPPLAGAVWMPWLALAVTGVAALACLWEGPARDAVARLYVLGLVAVAMMVNAFDLPPHRLLWTGTMVLAAYALAASYLWSRRGGLRAIADRLRIPRDADATELAGLGWLVPCNLTLIASIVGLAGLVELTEKNVPLRVLAAQAVLTQVVSLVLIARGDRRGSLQLAALALGAVGAVMFGWSWLVPGQSATLLNTLVVAAAAISVVAAFYGLGLGKLLAETSDWLVPARQLTPVLAALTLASLAAILATEVYQFVGAGEVAIAWPAILAVGLTLGGLSALALAAAVLPGRDPLNLSLRGRTLYVYGAEVLLALLFVHVRLTMPWLFAGFFQRYWPLVVMAIAFLGVGFAELCRRYRQQVLAGPLENTGALLPVLPVLGFWVESRVDYSALLVIVGVLYAGLSIARRSFGFGVLAALAANGGLWFFLNRQDGFGFLAHPQIWLIPPAVCVLVAAYFNREQLSGEQLTAVRYLTSTTIYVSSTADIFLNGVAQQPWLPVVLAGLSLAGIIAGIVLRVRAFLLLGTSFLGLALFTIIWHAAVDLDQTWIWYASGIIAGVAIIALFAVFEKKRQDVIEILDDIKRWDA